MTDTDPPSSPPRPPIVRPSIVPDPSLEPDRFTIDGEREYDESRWGPLGRVRSGDDPPPRLYSPGRPKRDDSVRGVLASMKIGDSVTFPRSSLHSLSATARKLGIRVTTRKLGTITQTVTVGPKWDRREVTREVDAVRVWRIE